MTNRPTQCVGPCGCGLVGVCFLICAALVLAPSGALAFNQTTGACCVDTTHTCLEDLLEEECDALGGRFGGVPSTCADFSPVCECTPVDCDDDDACTLDECDPFNGDAVTGCVHTPLDPTVDCSDNNACTIDDCDPAIGCTSTPIDSEIDCDDSNLCTIDDCDPAVGCTNTPIDPEDVCADTDLCTIDACDPAIGCTHTPLDPDVDCDDSDLCTIDGCDPAIGCTNAPVDPEVDCDDSDLCTIDDCDPAVGCTNAPVICTDDQSFCTGVEECDPATGLCGSSGEPCASNQMCCEASDDCGVECCLDSECPSDGIFCNGDELCDGGFCESSGNPCGGAQLCCEVSETCAECCGNADCNDGDVCTFDSCNSGTCQHTDRCGACCTASGSCSELPLPECLATLGTFMGDGSACEGDADADGRDDLCPFKQVIPTVSQWGLVVMTLLILTIARVRFRHRSWSPPIP